jgi:hypothetical protein
LQRLPLSPNRRDPDAERRRNLSIRSVGIALELKTREGLPLDYIGIGAGISRGYGCRCHGFAATGETEQAAIRVGPTDR